MNGDIKYRYAFYHPYAHMYILFETVRTRLLIDTFVDAHRLCPKNRDIPLTKTDRTGLCRLRLQFSVTDATAVTGRVNRKYLQDTPGTETPPRHYRSSFTGFIESDPTRAE